MHLGPVAVRSQASSRFASAGVAGDLQILIEVAAVSGFFARSYAGWQLFDY